MSKELPWFKFWVSDWQNGDIAFMSFIVKGIFIDLCSMYWYRECELKKSMIINRFSDYQNELAVLLDSEIIKVDEEENIEISFLKEQWEIRQAEHRRNVESGRKGGLKRANNAKRNQAPLKPPLSILEQNVLILNENETGFK